MIKINKGAISSTINLWKMCLWWLGSIYKTLLIHFLVRRTIVVTAAICHLESDACVPFFAIYVCCPQYIVSTPVSMLSLPIFHRWQRYLLYFWSPSFLTGQHFFGQKRAKNYTLCYHEKSPAKVLTGWWDYPSRVTAANCPRDMSKSNTGVRESMYLWISNPFHFQSILKLC